MEDIAKLKADLVNIAKLRREADKRASIWHGVIGVTAWKSYQAALADYERLDAVFVSLRERLEDSLFGK